MKLETICEDIEKMLKEVYSFLGEIDKEAADDIFKLTSGLLKPTSIFKDEDIAYLDGSRLYDKAVDQGLRLDLLLMHFTELLNKVMDSAENILDKEQTSKAHDGIVDISKKYEETLGIHRRLLNTVRSKRLVVDPIKEIVGLTKVGTMFGKLRKGHSYLFMGDRPDRALDAFATYVKNGYHGLSISRYYPKKIRRKYGLEKTPMLWLSHTEGDENHIEPSNLGVLTNIMMDFFSKTENGIVLLEGLEYLIIQNGFDTVLRFLQYMNEHIVTNDMIFVVPLDADSLQKRELALIKAELEVLD